MPTHSRADRRAGRRLLATAVAAPLAMAATAAPAQTASTTPATRTATVVVEGERIILPSSTAADPGAPNLPPAPDGGALLRNLPGVTAGRMGGHGLEPVIRGQQQGQLGIKLDGAYVFGGCPNRMDPPASFASPALYDRVTVTRGYQTVTEGPGAPGGSIRFDRDPPRLTDTQPATARFGGGLQSNGFGRDAFADVAAGGPLGGARATLLWQKAGDYEDGSGNEVRSGFAQRAGDVTLAWTPNAATEIELGMGLSRTDDVLFAGAGMDAPKTDDDTLRLRAARDIDQGALQRVEVEVAHAMVEHLMDNYSLRTRTAPMAMRVPSESDTTTGRIAGDLIIGDAPAQIGADLQISDRTARRYSGMADGNVNTLQSIMWPDTEITQIGLFGETDIALGQSDTLVVGARYDYVRARSDAADEVVPTTGRSPNDLYAMYYGVRAGTEREHNLGGLLRLEHGMRDGVLLYGAVSRSVRTADTTERAIASDQMASSWVGNPAIAPEKHYQAELGLEMGGGGWSLNAAAYADRVDDFILRDTARGQDGILMANGATVYRNVDALLAGVELGGAVTLGDGWSISGNVFYTYGQNLDDDTPLAQIPPLQGSVELAYAGDGWSVGTRLRGAATQTRVDDDPATGSGRDAGKTDGYVAQDLFASVSVAEPVELRLGVTNLFDATYADHLNRASAFDPTEVQVNEPGRSVYLQLRAAF